jgi:hypothetical protein
VLIVLKISRIITHDITKKIPTKLIVRILKIGIDILSQALGQVPSAQAGLTTLFGMGRGSIMSV